MRRLATAGAYLGGSLVAILGLLYLPDRVGPPVFVGVLIAVPSVARAVVDRADGWKAMLLGAAALGLAAALGVWILSSFAD